MSRSIMIISDNDKYIHKVPFQQDSKALLVLVKHLIK